MYKSLGLPVPPSLHCLACPSPFCFTTRPTWTVQGTSSLPVPPSFLALPCDQVEAAAKEMAKEVAVGLEEGASLVARAEKGLEVSETRGIDGALMIVA